MADKSRLKTVVMTQSDRFFIPHNIRIASEVCNMVEIVEVDCKSSLDNKLGDYLKWFGFRQCARMGVKTVLRAAAGAADRLTGYRILGGECSVKDAARALGVGYRVINDSNSPDFVSHMRDISPDLVISYSAPQIIKPELLSVPRYGIINVHGSLLPDYRGCLPSFWHLYNDEKTGGATVHFMSEEIDDGGIIKQESVDISDCRTMYKLISRTKRLGGELMLQAIMEITGGKAEIKQNDIARGRYYTWPSVEQAKEFRNKGYRLI